MIDFYYPGFISRVYEWACILRPQWVSMEKLMTPFDISLYNTGIGDFLAVCMVRL